jgi:7-keto-8-aminopelargonate synthetase and related enzymes
MNLDFTSALYLGFWHESKSLKPWSQLTTGQPAILAEVAGSEVVADQLAQLQGCDQAVLSSSTLHLFWDLFGMLADERIAIFLDDGAYSIAQWGIERAVARGVPVSRFPHKDAGALQRLLERTTGGRRPVVVADGICTACGCAMPIKAYHELVRRAGGLLVIDDTQALGLLGMKHDSRTPYGVGGGGSLRHQNVSGADILLVSSLAKGFGVPIALLSGSSNWIQKFKVKSQTRVHCSPPSAADIHAAQRALDLNAKDGDALRLQLARRIKQFRNRLVETGFFVDSGLFPMQTLRLPEDQHLGQIQVRLLDLGIRTILRRGCDGRPCLSLIITTRHQPEDFDNVAQSLTIAMSMEPQMELEGG